MRELELRQGNTVAVVVTYQPDAQVIPRLRALAQQFGIVVVIDNGSSDETVASLRALSDATSDTVLISNGKNPNALFSFVKHNGARRLKVARMGC